MFKCRVCNEEFEREDINMDGNKDVAGHNEGSASGECKWCHKKLKMAAFASECGLRYYPDPTGERYLYKVDDVEGYCKKSENVEFMDALWAALVRAKGGEDVLLPGK